MRILVTGGGGLIGRSVVRILAAKGHDVTVLDDFRLSRKDEVVVQRSLRYVEGTVQDATIINELVADQDAVIHLAAPSSFLMYEENPLDSTFVTIEGFLNILEAMRKSDVTNLVYASTSAVYEGNPVPYEETMDLKPPDLKALSKKWNEEAAAQYSDRWGIRAIGLRPFSVYGQGEHNKKGYANVISLFVWAAMNGEIPIVWGDGSQTRDYIYVEDAAKAFVMAVENTEIETQTINVGTGIETTFNEVIAIIGQELDIELTPRYVPVPIAIYAHRLLADTTRQEKVLGFRHETSVREGVRRVIAATRELQARGIGLANHQRYFERLSEGSLQTTP